jgi:hypothetical protein
MQRLSVATDIYIGRRVEVFRLNFAFNLLLVETTGSFIVSDWEG